MWGGLCCPQQYKDHSAHGSRARGICSGPVLRGREMYINFVAHLRYSYLLCMVPTAIQRGYSCLRQEEKKSLQTETAGWTSLIILINLVSPICLLGAYLLSKCLQKAVKCEQERWSCSQRGSTYSLKSSSSIFLKQCLMMQSVVLKEMLLLLPFFSLDREEGYSLGWGRLLEGIWSASMQREVRTVSWSQSNRDRSTVASLGLPNWRGSNSSASWVVGSERQESTIARVVAACMLSAACWESSCMF